MFVIFPFLYLFIIVIANILILFIIIFCPPFSLFCHLSILVHLCYCYCCFCFPSGNVEDENRKNTELSGLNKQASWVMDMMYGKREESSGRRDSLTNIQNLASRISSLQEKEALENGSAGGGGGGGGGRAPVEVNAQTSVKVRIGLFLLILFICTSFY